MRDHVARRAAWGRCPICKANGAVQATRAASQQAAGLRDKLLCRVAAMRPPSPPENPPNEHMLVWGISLFIAFQHKNAEKTLYIVSLPVGIFFTMQTAMFLTSIRNAKSTLLVALFLLGAVFPTVKKPPLKRSGSNLICRKQQFPFFYARFDDEAYL